MYSFIAYLIAIWIPLVCSRALLRSSVSTILANDAVLDSGQYAHKLLAQNEYQAVSSNVNASDQIYHDVLSFLSTQRLHRRAGKQPAPATNDILATSAAKGCNLLYMLAANADDALTRLKANNPGLTGLSSSQSAWDNAGALKQYGWTEKKDSVNWPYMGINDVMKELDIDTTSKDNMNIQLVQDTAVTVHGKDFVVSGDTCKV